jgi:hypothetical protein
VACLSPCLSRQCLDRRLGQQPRHQHGIRRREINESTNRRRGSAPRPADAPAAWHRDKGFGACQEKSMRWNSRRGGEDLCCVNTTTLLRFPASIGNRTAASTHSIGVSTTCATCAGGIPSRGRSPRRGRETKHACGSVGGNESRAWKAIGALAKKQEKLDDAYSFCFKRKLRRKSASSRSGRK